MQVAVSVPASATRIYDPINNVRPGRKWVQLFNKSAVDVIYWRMKASAGASTFVDADGIPLPAGVTHTYEDTESVDHTSYPIHAKSLGATTTVIVSAP